MINRENIILLLCVTAAIFLWLDYRHKVKTAYCFEEKRYVSHEELCDTAVRALYGQLEKYYSVFTDEEKAQTIIYTSPEDMKARNPLICKPSAKPFGGHYSGRPDYYEFLRQRYGSSFYTVPLFLQLDNDPSIRAEAPNPYISRPENFPYYHEYQKNYIEYQKHPGRQYASVHVKSCGKEYSETNIHHHLYPRNY